MKVGDLRTDGIVPDLPNNCMGTDEVGAMNVTFPFFLAYKVRIRIHRIYGSALLTQYNSPTLGIVRTPRRAFAVDSSGAEVEAFLSCRPLFHSATKA